MSWEAWFWLLLDLILIAWFIRFVREPIASPKDWTTRVATSENSMEGDHGADHESH